MDKAKDIVFQAIDQVNRLRSKLQQIAKKEETKLTGSDGLLDSLALVNLMVAIEEILEDQYEIEVTLGQESSTFNDHFSTVGLLIAHIDSLVKESND